MLLVANITSVEIRILKTFMGNSLKMFAQSRLSFKDEKFLITKIPYQKKETIICFCLRSVYILSLSLIQKKEVIQTFTSLEKRKKNNEDQDQLFKLPFGKKIKNRGRWLSISGQVTEMTNFCLNTHSPNVYT